MDHHQENPTYEVCFGNTYSKSKHFVQYLDINFRISNIASYQNHGRDFRKQIFRRRRLNEFKEVVQTSIPRLMAKDLSA